MIVEALLRSSALLAASFAVSWLARKQSAQFRNAILRVTCILLFALPLLTLLTPEMHAQRSASVHIAIQTVAFETLRASPHVVNWVFVVWAAGFAVSAAPQLVGLIVVARWIKAASRFERHARVYTCSRISIPVTCGLVRPRILLPMEAENWTEARLNAVLAHEQAHIERRDLAVQFFANFVTALWWFQPLVWIARNKLRQTSELACDEAAVRRGIRPSEYAAELLAIARAATSPMNAGAIAMASNCNVERRITAVLQAGKHSARPGSHAAFFSGLLVCSVLSSAFPNPQGGSSMKRAILSALLTSAALSATNITGVVRDAKGSPIPDADVTVTNPDTGVTKHTISGAGGEFTLEIESTSPVIVRAEKAGQPLADYRIDAAVDGEKSVRIGGRIAEANLIKKVNPVYPPEAKAEGVEGTVTIGCTISTQGVPSELYIMSSDSDALSQSALDAVRQWRYKPTLLNGNPVAVQTVITVNYTLAK